MSLRSGDVTAIALLLALAGLFVGQCGREQDGREAERVAINERNAVVASRAYKASRVALDSAAAAFKDADQRRQWQRSVSVATMRRADATVDSLRVTLSRADNPANVDTLRAVADAALSAYDSLAVAFRSYLAADSVADHANRNLHLGFARSLALADSTIAAERAVSAALRQQARCRVAFVPCPSRRTAFVAGAVAGAVLVVRVAR